MRNLLVLFALLSPSCATTPDKPPSKIAIKPSDVDPALQPLDEQNPFTTEKYKIDLEKTEIAKYDEFLLEAASVKGGVVLTDFVLEDTEAALQELAELPAGKVDDYEALGNEVAKKRGAFKPEPAARIRRNVAMLDALVAVIKDLPERAQRVKGKGDALASQAKSEATKNPVQMAKVAGPISSALAEVASASAAAPGLVERSGNVVKALALCGCGYDNVLLLPKDISSALEPLYAANPFEAEETRVDYVVTGLADFDGFFRDVAVLRGTALLVDVWVRDVGATLAEIAQKPVPTTPQEVQKLVKSMTAKKTKPQGDVVMKMRNHVAQAKEILTVLTNAPAKVKELTENAKGLGAAAATAATTSPARTAGLPLALEDSTKALVDTGTKVGASLKLLKDLMTQVSSFAP